MTRLTLPVVMVSLLDTRLSNLTDHNEEADTLMAAADETNAVTLPTDNGMQLWRYFNTPDYRKLVQAQDSLYK